jgi:hypothetical protein
LTVRLDVSFTFNRRYAVIRGYAEDLVVLRIHAVKPHRRPTPNLHRLVRRHIRRPVRRRIRPPVR